MNRTQEPQTERTQPAGQGAAHDRSGFDLSKDIKVSMTTDRKRSPENTMNNSLNGSKNSGSRRSRKERFLSPDEPNSSMRNANFVEYVVGGDTLLPRRVRSRKSDLPYSEGSGSRAGGSRAGRSVGSSQRNRRLSADAEDIIRLQE